MICPYLCPGHRLEGLAAHLGGHSAGGQLGEPGGEGLCPLLGQQGVHRDVGGVLHLPQHPAVGLQLQLEPLKEGVTFPFVSNGGTAMIASWGLLAFLKATDTRQNASFAIRLPSRREDRRGAALAPKSTDEWEADDEED